jgi:hypothetical protein
MSKLAPFNIRLQQMLWSEKHSSLLWQNIHFMNEKELKEKPNCETNCSHCSGESEKFLRKLEKMLSGFLT